MCAHVWAGRQDIVIRIEINEIVLFMVLFNIYCVRDRYFWRYNL